MIPVPLPLDFTVTLLVLSVMLDVGETVSQEGTSVIVHPCVFSVVTVSVLPVDMAEAPLIRMLRVSTDNRLLPGTFTSSCTSFHGTMRHLILLTPLTASSAVRAPPEIGRASCRERV